MEGVIHTDTAQQGVQHGAGGTTQLQRRAGSWISLRPEEHTFKDAVTTDTWTRAGWLVAWDESLISYCPLVLYMAGIVL